MKFSLVALTGIIASGNASPMPVLTARGTIQTPFHFNTTLETINKNQLIQAMRFDPGATRALTGTTIKTAAGKCLSVNPFSGDTRMNLITIDVKDCDGSKNQTWDIMTKATHLDDTANGALIVNSLTNGCLNYDPRKACGQQALVFSCGGRADGFSAAASSQIFNFTDVKGAQQFQPANAKAGQNQIDGCTGADSVPHPTGVCFAVQGSIVGVADCNPNDENQQFTYGGSAPGAVASDGLEDAGFYNQQDIDALIASGFMTTVIGQSPPEEEKPPPFAPVTGVKSATGKQSVGNSTTDAIEPEASDAAGTTCKA